MKAKETAEKIKYAIEKECSSDSLSAWCDYWGFAVEDFEQFLDCAMNSYSD